MNRTLSITLDDEAKTICIEGSHLFTVLELYGIAEHLNVKTRLTDIRIMDACDKEETEEEVGQEGEE